MEDKIKVLLLTEGTYPFHQGGVSTWCDILVKQLKDVDFVIYCILMDPFVTQKFKLSDNTGLVKLPLWGTEEPSEHLTTSFSKDYLSKKRTTKNIIQDKFIPLFNVMIEEFIAVNKDHHRLAYTLLDLYLFFQEYDYKQCFKSEITWDAYKEIIFKNYRDGSNNLARPDLYCLIQSLGWVYRFMNVLNTPIPDVHVTHASAAAFCGIPGVLAKLKDKTPFLLTEHGIYLREQYLSLGKREYSSFLNTFLIRLIQSVTGLNYTFADQVSPVCQYNTRWEKQFQVPEKRIQVIYNGVDQRVFTEAPPGEHAQPTVVTVARIDPLKDIITLIKSAAIVKTIIPNVKFIVYGSVSVPSYNEECLALRDQLELTETVTFAGHTTNMSKAYQSGDIIALTSISEAFPYSVVEAMMTGKPCISTDVGGIREAVGDTGILVNPRDYEALAEGLVKLFNNPQLRTELGQDGRERALNYFTLDRVLELHLKSYIRLSLVGEEKVVRPSAETEFTSITASMQRQHLFTEKAYVYMFNNKLKDAISHFRIALLEMPNSAAAPLLLLEIAECYNRLGEFDKAFAALEKQSTLAFLIEHRIA